MNATQTPPPKGSPLDPFLTQFLTIVAARDQGFQPGPETAEMATSLNVPRAFVEALYTSARTRGLVKPKYGRGSRMWWVVSPAGSNLIEQNPPHQEVLIGSSSPVS